MRNEHEIDMIMKQSLRSDQEPDPELNASIIRQWKEDYHMTGKTRRRLPATAAAVLCILAASVTVGAAAKYLNATQVAEEFAQPEIQKAFQSKDALEVNETKEAGDYRFTFLGIASGKAITKTELTKQIPENGQSYAVLAIERRDGKPMPQISDEAYNDLKFCVSPLIQGLDPMEYNIFYTGGGYSDAWKNGVLYRIVDCDQLEKFADKEVYLSITDSMFFENTAFNYDKSTGKITENKDYNGINLLFDIPFDKSKADSEAVEKYLKALEESQKEGDAIDDDALSDDETADGGLIVDSNEESEVPAVEEIVGRAELVGDSVQELTEEDGKYVYKYKNGIECTVYPESDFPDGKTGWSDNVMYSEDDSEKSYVLFNRDEDGTITGSIYREKK